MIYIFIVVFVSLTILMCWQESRKRKINFLVAILICLIATPLVGYFVLNGRPLRKPITKVIDTGWLEKVENING